MLKPASGTASGNRYDEPMVVHDVSAFGKTPGTLLVARLHVDLCRLASAICPRRAQRAPLP
ncbi:hypothetical protein GCM10009863_32190 [Streptomyces axinellae]|uniref:Uncharacterized protein n=1 Tax=Streptomyces axinellae TaxID=552788 RepID=A0ABN3Q423_9ACTN